MRKYTTLFSRWEERGVWWFLHGAIPETKRNPEPDDDGVDGLQIVTGCPKEEGGGRRGAETEAQRARTRGVRCEHHPPPLLLISEGQGLYACPNALRRLSWAYRRRDPRNGGGGGGGGGGHRCCLVVVVVIMGREKKNGERGMVIHISYLLSGLHCIGLFDGRDITQSRGRKARWFLSLLLCIRMCRAWKGKEVGVRVRLPACLLAMMVITLSSPPSILSSS